MFDWRIDMKGIVRALTNMIISFMIIMVVVARIINYEKSVFDWWQWILMVIAFFIVNWEKED
jgi:hypothetical protein